MVRIRTPNPGNDGTKSNDLSRWPERDQAEPGQRRLQRHQSGRGALIGGPPPRASRPGAACPAARRGAVGVGFMPGRGVPGDPKAITAAEGITLGSGSYVPVIDSAIRSPRRTSAVGWAAGEVLGFCRSSFTCPFAIAVTVNRRRDLFHRVQTVWLRAWHVHAASGN